MFIEYSRLIAASTDLELLDLYVEEEVLVNERTSILLSVLQQVLVEEQHWKCQVTPGRLLQGLEELVLILLVGLGSTSLSGETQWGTVSELE